MLTRRKAGNVAFV